MTTSAHAAAGQPAVAAAPRRNAVVLCTDKRMLVPALFVAEAVRRHASGAIPFEIVAFDGMSGLARVDNQGRTVETCALMITNSGVHRKNVAVAFNYYSVFGIPAVHTSPFGDVVKPHAN